MNIAVIFAGGSGIRLGAGVPKQFLEINGKPILIHTLQLFQKHSEIDKIYMAVLEDYIPYTKELVDEYRVAKVAGIVPGGETAQDSIYLGLRAARKENPPESIVLIHDGVRPFVSYDVISANIGMVKSCGNAITSTACYETIMLSKDGRTVDTVPYRRESFSAQAPQSFRLGDILSYHEEIRKRPGKYEDIVDACTILKVLGIPAHIVEGNRGNIKVTTPEDVYMFRALLQYKENEQTFGIGLTNRIGKRMR